MISEVTEVKKEYDIFDELPDEIVYSIFLKLNFAELGTVSRVCHRFRMISSDKELISPLWNCAKKVIGYVYYPIPQLQGHRFINSYTKLFRSYPWKLSYELGLDYCKKISSTVILPRISDFGMILNCLDSGIAELLQIKRALKVRWRDWALDKKLIVIDPTWNFSLISFKALLEVLVEMDTIEELVLPSFRSPIALELIDYFKKGELRVKKIVLNVRFHPDQIRRLFESLKQLKSLTFLNINYSTSEDVDIIPIEELILRNTSIKKMHIKDLPNVSERVLKGFKASVNKSPVTIYTGSSSNLEI